MKPKATQSGIILRIPRVYGRAPVLSSEMKEHLGDWYGHIMWITMAWGPRCYRCLAFHKN